MNIIHYLDAIFLKLSVIPGLGFLHEYVEELEIQQQRRRVATDKYRGYAGALRGAGEAAKHGGHHGDEKHGKHEEHGHGKPVKRGKSARKPRPGTGGQATRAAKRKEDDTDAAEEDYYEDDDFESYLQR